MEMNTLECFEGHRYSYVDQEESRSLKLHHQIHNQEVILTFNLKLSSPVRPTRRQTPVMVLLGDLYTNPRKRSYHTQKPTESRNRLLTHSRSRLQPLRAGCKPRMPHPCTETSTELRPLHAEATTETVRHLTSGVDRTTVGNERKVTVHSEQDEQRLREKKGVGNSSSPNHDAEKLKTSQPRMKLNGRLASSRMARGKKGMRHSFHSSLVTHAGGQSISMTRRVRAAAGSKTTLAQVGRVEGLSAARYPTTVHRWAERMVHSLINGRRYPRTVLDTGLLLGKGGSEEA